MLKAVSPIFNNELFAFTFKNSKNNFIYFKNNNYFFLLPSIENYSFLNLNYFISLNFKFNFNCLNQTFIELTSLSYFFFLKSLKFSFRGKGHKLLMNKRYTLTFNFGHSHLFYVYNFTSKIFMLTKTRGFFLGLNGFMLNEPTANFNLTNPMNIYTQNGIKFRKSV